MSDLDCVVKVYLEMVKVYLEMAKVTGYRLTLSEMIKLTS